MSIVAVPNVRASDLLTPERTQKHFELQRKPVYAVPTPLPSWNRVCRDDGGGKGLPLGWMVTIAAATGAGKSIMALNLAAEAVRNSERVGVVSLEMSPAQMYTRYLAIATGENVRHLERGPSFDDAVAKRAETFIAEQREATGGGLHINEDPITDIDTTLELMSFWYTEQGIRYFIVDYVQLLGSRDAESLYSTISNVSNSLREFAKRTHSTVIALSQLNRSVSANRAESPIVQGLMGSSSVENDSDQVVLLDHSRYEYDKARRTARTWLLIGKNRHGPCGAVPVKWSYTNLRLREADPDEENTWPGARP